MKRAMRNKKVINTVVAVLVVMLLAASGLTASPPTAADDTSCIDFEGLPLGTEYHVGDTFTESGLFMKVDSFQWSNGEWTDDGYASVGDEVLAGGSGQEVFLNNVIMHFESGGSCEGLSLLFGAYGGNLNIDINSDFRNFDVFDDIDGLTIGGVNVVINDFGSGKGSLTLSGTVEGFFIGGQELVIDHVCLGIPSEPTGTCVDFEDLPLGAEYHVGDAFTDSGADMEVEPHQWDDGQWTDDGLATVDNGGYAGGSGQDMWLFDVNLRFDLGGPCEGLSLLLGAYGGNLNIEINGDFRNFNDFDDIDGSTVGGVNVAINYFGDGKGSLTLSGTINQNSFAIGGQEFCIDDVCSEIQAGEKPDLIITDVWSEDSTICYQIMNTGAAVAREGHYTGLSIDGVQRILDYVAADLLPGERLNKCFDYDWVCTPAQDAVKVWADYSGDIAESNEANNCREETWKCDSTPPTIVLSPTVSEITTSSAVVSWDTDEASDSAVTYDKAAGKYDFEKTASNLVRSHEIALTSLQPSTTYHFVVQSTDSSGNSIQSKDIAFETLATPDYEDPVISAVDQAGCTGITTITAAASDNIGVERVEFYLEGERIYTDYSASSPFKIPWDPGELPNGFYDLVVKAYDPFGNLATMAGQAEACNLDPDIVFPDVWITNPIEGETVSGNVTIAVYVSDDVAVKRVDFFVDGSRMGEAIASPYTYLWEPGRSYPQHSQHTIMAIVTDTGNNIQSDSVTVWVNWPQVLQPRLELTNLSCTRHGNYFETVLEVHNAGTADATDFGIRMYHHGFQCVSETNVLTSNAVYNVSANYLVEEPVSRAEIRYDGTLIPGESDEITVYLVPILYDSANFPYAVFSSFEVSYTPDDEGGWEETCGLPIVDREVSGLSGLRVEDAVSLADYLIVTNPENLFAFNARFPEEVNELLSAMAELAMLKNGVLGYLYSPAAILTSYDTYDALACGDIDHNSNQNVMAEIIVAENWDGTADIYGDAHKKYTISTNYSKDDYLLCGDVDGDDNAEIIVTEHEGVEKGWVYVYGYHRNSTYDPWEWGQEYSFPTSFDEGDTVVCGNVDLNIRGAEIIVADDDSGWADIYSTRTNDREYSVNINYELGDSLMCGDTDGDGEEEILKFEDEEYYGTLTVYSISSTGGAVQAVQDYSTSNLGSPDRLLCGDVDGDNEAEFVRVMSSGEARVDDIPMTSGSSWSVRTDYDSGNGLLCGDVDGDNKAEIIVVQHKGALKGWIDIFACVESHTGDRNRLDDLIDDGGDWSTQLSHGWASNGYLLIVGETEIIPAWATVVDSDTYNIHEVVRCTDHKYSNTGGKFNKPDLSIGRIIGNTARALTVPIEASIGVCQGETGYEFDRSHAVVVAGRGKGVGDFEKCAGDVRRILRDAGFSWVDLVKQRDVEPDYSIATEFKYYVEDTDVIFYRDHCGTEKWGDGSAAVSIGDFYGTDPVSFGDTKPFVFACCCLAGQYAGISGIAEVFLGHGAAAYIGATEVSYNPYNDYAAKNFFNRWANSDKTIGLALKEMKRDFVDHGLFDGKYYRPHWVYEYHLYGDPKYGGSSVTNCTGLMALAETEMQGPLSSLDVIVPDYEVTTVEGEDYVEIPGGDVFMVPDKPLVPFYTVSLDYPKGYEVEDVILTDRSGLATADGLNIPSATILPAGEANVEAMGGSEVVECWPEDVFDWAVFENGDGSTTLAISICAFYYNPLTTDVRFYKNFSFDIDYTVSTVEISRLETDKHIYEQGEQVLVDMEINNSAAEAQDVLVDAVIEAESSGEIVGGLLLRTLKGLAGPASFSPYWDSTGFEPGYYYVKVTLKDTAGNVLDRKTEMFRLGVCSGEIASFAATPESSDIGDEIDISLAFNNIGTVDISGTALIRIQDEAGDIVQEFSHNVTDLAPDESVSFDDTWDTSGTEEGTYHINGLVFYDGQAAGLSITATTTAEPSDEEPSGGLCFIATAAYGTPMAEEIEILRQFRDEYLLTNSVGQTLVDVYYEVSPPMAEFITEHPSLRPIVRAGLLPAVAMSTLAVNTTPTEKIFILGFLVLVSLAATIWAKRRRNRGPQYTRG